MRKYLALFAVILAFALVIAGCGTNNNKENATNENTTQENNTATKETTQEEPNNLLEKVKAEGKLLIGTEGTYAPFTFHDESGKLTGFDVELAEEVAKRIGVEPVFMETQWDAMFAGLDSERFDMIANQVGIKPDRQEKYDFSKAYISSSMVLVTHKNNDSVKAFEDIKGLKAAQTMTSNYGDKAREYGAEIVGVEGFTQTIDLITSERADVTLNDRLSVLDFLKQKPDAPIKIVASSSDTAQSGFMFRKGNAELVEAVNQALNEIMADGTYLKISEKWFGEDVSK